MPYFIGLGEGILDPKHRQALGLAIYLFGWYVRRQTDPNGRVAGGRVLTAKEVSESLGIPIRTFRRWQAVLVGENPDSRTYVEQEVLPGLGFRVTIARPLRHRRKGGGYEQSRPSGCG